ncbi:hypothetical protein Gasu2_52140 [Galdieria sulphuraria]|nr:hypothetical protein Gasu2_52140 [Galdieria sulphuraria]
MEAFAEQDLLRHRIHLKWKYYPERLRKRRVIRGTHLSISRWNKVALTLSVVILRSATDTLWFIIRPIFIEGYHILHGSIQKAIELLWTDKSGDIQSPSSKGLLQVTVAKNFRDRTHLENSMSIILSNFTTFWKFERALSKISRKAILWGVVEEGSSTKVDGIGRQSNVDRNELFTTRSSYYDEETNHSSGFFPIGILELTGVGFILFLFRLFPFLSESLVDICTFLFQLFAIYLFGTFTLATWRIVTESVHFCRVYETLQGHFSILLRHSMITKMNGNETIDIIAWEVNDKDELEKYSLCKYVEELWEEGICRAEMILRRIPSVLVESSPMGWQLLSLFEREECEIERIA